MNLSSTVGRVCVPRPSKLCRQQGGHQRTDQGPGQGVGGAEGPRKCRRPRHDRNRHESSGSRHRRRPNQGGDPDETHRKPEEVASRSRLPGQRRRSVRDRPGAARGWRPESGWLLEWGGSSGLGHCANRLRVTLRPLCRVRSINEYGSVIIYQTASEVERNADKGEVYEKIKVALVDTLGVDEDEIKPEATLVGDLGASRSISWTSSSGWRRRSTSRFPAANCSPRTSYRPQVRARREVTELGWPSCASGCPLPTSTTSSRTRSSQDFGNLLTVADMCRFVEGKVEVTGLSPLARRESARDVPASVSRRLRWRLP